MILSLSDFVLKQNRLTDQFCNNFNRGMSNQESLLGFLKKKSLFNQSPVRYPNGKRQRSSSKEGKESIIRKINDKDLDDDLSPINKLNNNPNNNDHNNYSPKRGLFQNDYQATFSDNNTKRENRSFEPQQINERFKEPPEKLSFNVQDKSNKLLTGLVAYSSSFESARVESAQCLQTLSLKLKTEISNVNYRIGQFRDNMVRVLNNQLKALREQILQLIDSAFKQSQRNIKEYVKIEEQKLANDLLKIRQTLEKEYVRVQTMNQEIAQPQWRKVAGEVLATQLQKNLQELIKKSSNTEIGRWQSKNLSGQRLKALEKELRQLVRLKE